MEESRFFMEKIGRDAGRRDGHQKPLACWPGNRWKKPSLGWPSMQRDPVCMERQGGQHLQFALEKGSRQKRWLPASC